MGIRTTQDMRISQTDNILRNIKDELHDMNHGIKNMTAAIKSLDDAYRAVNGEKIGDPNEAKSKTVSADDVLHMIGGPGYRAGGSNGN